MGLLVGLPLKLFSILFALVRLALPILLPLALGWFLQRMYLRRRRGEEAAPPPRKEREPEFTGPVYTVNYREVAEPEPETPVPFGDKTAWAVVRGTPEEVAQALGGKLEPVGWREGLERACRQGGGVFLSPELDGWTAIVGNYLFDWDDEQKEELDALAARFSEVQYFYGHNATGDYCWAKFVQGQPVRYYSWDGQAGKVLRDEGELTPEEIALDFGRFPRQGREGACENCPGQEDVLDIAAAWGLDPRMEGRTERTVGFRLT